MKKSELISAQYSGIFPVDVNIYNYGASVMHWHPEIELFFVLAGSMDVLIEDTSFTAQEEDVFLVNANELHQISGTNCEVLSLRFHVNHMPYLDSTKVHRFDLNSSGNTHGVRYDFIRHLIAQFAKISSSGEHIYKAISMVFAIYSHLNENFLAAPISNPPSSQKKRERINTIIKYMEEHYTECLSLSDVADAQNLSAPYLASYFEKNTGQTFLAHYNQIRLTHAVYAMLTTDDSLEQIALSHGFNDSRTFTALFKKKYNTLPSTYRKEHSMVSSDGFLSENEGSKEATVKNVEKARHFQSLTRYLTIYNPESSVPSLLSNSPRTIDAGNINFSTSGVSLNHTYHRLMCVGSAKQFLYKEVQDMIRMTQKDIHYDYVKFHGLLSDDMIVYTEQPDGTPVYTFTLIDKVIDFMLSVNLRPFCQLSFMPLDLASDPTRMVNMWRFNTSPPKDMVKWTNLIDTLIRHFIKRYGMAEVRNWLFCVWNEPDETVEEFSWSDRKLFFNFYKNTYQTVKNINPDFQFGTPSLLLSLTAAEGWAAEFFQFCARQDCRPDFLNIHYYDNTLFEADARERPREGSGFSNKSMNESFALSLDPYAFWKFINSLKVMLKKFNMKNLPIYLTEWNLTISHRDLINDTCFKSCYMIKNLLENYDRLDSFGYWCLTDFIEELPLPDNLFHGGLGMFTYNGIPKAHFNAFRFLSHLDDTLIGKGDGFFITKGYDRLTILVYNYEHYSKLFATGFMSNISDKNRYAPFTEMNTAQFMVQFDDIPFSKCLIKEMYINQRQGSSYDAWIRMGAQPLTKDDDVKLLRHHSQPGMYLHQDNIENNRLTLHIKIDPLEVRLIEIEFHEPAQKL